MKVLVITTWDNPKCEEDLKKYYEYMEKHGPYWNERRKKYNVKQSAWVMGLEKCISG